ncbi:MAG: DNA-directed RNA polymerase subunit delta [Bacilli bacterium]|nr:DNA-directed RNA polymerase subunit delta [Bacilli bacterium]
MDLEKTSKDELELLSYTDITYYLLDGKNKQKTTAELFRSIMQMLELSESVFAAQIGDYYTSLTTDKRFIILDNGKWDLRHNHSSDKLKAIEDDEDYEDESEEFDIETDEDDEELEDFDITDDDDNIVDDDILDDLSIIDEENDEE